MPAPSSRRYLGFRTSHLGGATVMVIEESGTAQRALNPRRDVRDHSSDGFQWGYGGSGPAQLALALLCDALGDDDRAVANYQAFKSRVLARMVGDTWEMSAGGIVAEVEAIEKVRACA